MLRMNLRHPVTTALFVLTMVGVMYYFVQPRKSPLGLAQSKERTAPLDLDKVSDNRFLGEEERVSVDKIAAGTSPVQPTCKRIWQKGRSSWFDSRFDDNIRPVWSQANIELPADARTWWMARVVSLSLHFDRTSCT